MPGTLTHLYQLGLPSRPLALKTSVQCSPKRALVPPGPFGAFCFITVSLENDLTPEVPQEGGWPHGFTEQDNPLWLEGVNNCTSNVPNHRRNSPSPSPDLEISGHTLNQRGAHFCKTEELKTAFSLVPSSEPPLLASRDASDTAPPGSRPHCWMIISSLGLRGMQGARGQASVLVWGLELRLGGQTVWRMVDAGLVYIHSQIRRLRGVKGLGRQDRALRIPLDGFRGRGLELRV